MTYCSPIFMHIYFWNSLLAHRICRNSALRSWWTYLLDQSLHHPRVKHVETQFREAPSQFLMHLLAVIVKVPSSRSHQILAVKFLPHHHWNERRSTILVWVQKFMQLSLHISEETINLIMFCLYISSTWWSLVWDETFSGCGNHGWKQKHTWKLQERNEYDSYKLEIEFRLW